MGLAARSAAEAAPAHTTALTTTAADKIFKLFMSSPVQIDQGTKISVRTLPVEEMSVACHSRALKRIRRSVARKPRLTGNGTEAPLGLFSFVALMDCERRLKNRVAVRHEAEVS